MDAHHLPSQKLVKLSTYNWVVLIHHVQLLVLLSSYLPLYHFKSFIPLLKMELLNLLFTVMQTLSILSQLCRSGVESRLLLVTPQHNQ